ncbi:hypothetical protein OPV22_032006 [Ensete ventricosum]|uniref:BHLH domain-containing protein n=1 Tax=Ensete ventricosum TaxID=4639 RepID=A0AAV8PNN1_ENSVE|nr:hypothetical protein OPV22_032006 [Ensete ventricosum]
MPSFSLSSSSMSWTKSLLNSVTSEGSFHAMLQEDPGSRPCTSSGKEFSDVGVASYHFPASYGYSSVMLQDESGIHDSGTMNRYQSPVVAYQGSSNELRQPSWAKLSQLLKSPLSKQQSNNQSQFTNNNTLFWNASAAASVGDAKSILCSPTPSQFVMQPQTTCSNLAACRISPGGVQDSCSSSTKKTGSEPAVKKLRIEAPSPLPTFKVRKEKLGDRITALQQLVSPFGKTDTASVLQEAIEYIKFLHDQVGVLSSPYLKDGHPMQHQISNKSKDCDETKQDLRSRGLCLVPITSTYLVASETTADFWHPTFGVRSSVPVELSRDARLSATHPLNSELLRACMHYYWQRSRSGASPEVRELKRPKDVRNIFLAIESYCFSCVKLSE